MVSIFLKACRWMFFGSCSRLSIPVRFTNSLLLGPGVPIVFVYLPDEVLHLGECKEFSSIFIRGLAYRPDGGLVVEDPNRLELTNDLQVGVLKPAKDICAENEGLATLRSLDDEGASLLHILENVVELASGLGNPEHLRQLQHTVCSSIRQSSITVSSKRPARTASVPVR